MKNIYVIGFNAGLDSSDEILKWHGYFLWYQVPIHAAGFIMGRIKRWWVAR